MTNIISTIAFLAFVACGLYVSLTPAGRFRKNFFILLVIAMSFLPALAQRDMWPFSSWAMMVGVTPPATRDSPTLRIVGVDASGAEYDIDYRTWNPLSMEELYSWINVRFFKMSVASQQDAASYLLRQANQSREEALRGGGRFHGWLQALRAPTHLLHPAIWSKIEAVPRNPFVGLRMYNESWDLDSGKSGTTQRVLVYEYLPH